MNAYEHDFSESFCVAMAMASSHSLWPLIASSFGGMSYLLERSSKKGESLLHGDGFALESESVNGKLQ